MQNRSGALVVGLSLMLAACSAPSSPAAQPTGVVSASTPAAAVNASVATPAASIAIAGQKYTIVADKTEARYRVREQLGNQPLPNDAVGKTKAITGEFSLDASGGLTAGASKLVINVASLKSDQNQRDNFLRRSTLETDKFPTAEFVPTAIQGLTWPLPATGDVAFQIVGNLTAHGVTHPTTWQVTATVAGSTLNGHASTNFKFADFGMTQPRTALVLSVVDNIQLELDFQLARSG